jgi:hypothetical protein
MTARRASRLIPVILLVLLVVSATVVILASVPAVHASQPTTIASDVDFSATGNNFNRHMFGAKGLYWIVYATTSDIVFSTTSSLTSPSWSSPTTIRTNGLAGGGGLPAYFAIWNNSTTLAYVASTDYPLTKTVYFRYGTLGNAGGTGTVTWTTSEISFSQKYNNAGYPSITMSGKGDVWLGISGEDGSNNFHAEAYVCSKFNCASPTLKLDYDSAQSNHYWDSEVSSYNDATGNVLVMAGVYGGGDGLILDDYNWSTASFNGVINVYNGNDTSYLEPNRGTGVMKGGTFYFAGVFTNTGTPIGFFTHVFGSSSVPKVRQIMNGYNDGEATLTWDGASGLLVVAGSGAYLSNNAERDYVASSDMGSTWTAQQTIFSNEHYMVGNDLGSLMPFTSAAVVFYYVDSTNSGSCPCSLKMYYQNLAQVSSSSSGGSSSSTVSSSTSLTTSSTTSTSTTISASTTTITETCQVVIVISNGRVITEQIGQCH